jgi:hypothetical protein
LNALILYSIQVPGKFRNRPEGHHSQERLPHYVTVGGYRKKLVTQFKEFVRESGQVRGAEVPARTNRTISAKSLLTKPFDSEYMNQLFKVGYDLGATGLSMGEAAPGFHRPGDRAPRGAASAAAEACASTINKIEQQEAHAAASHAGRAPPEHRWRHVAAEPLSR